MLHYLVTVKNRKSLKDIISKLCQRRKKKEGKPEVHDDLSGFEIRINEFGEIVSNFKVEELNEFLDENVEDKKLVEKQLKDAAKEEEE